MLCFQGLAQVIAQADAIASNTYTPDLLEPAEQPWADAKVESTRRIARRERAVERNATVAGGGTVLIL